MQPDKENLQAYRKTSSLNTCVKDYDSLDLATLLHKVQICKESKDVTEIEPIEEEIEDKNTTYKMQAKKPHQTCRYIPLRKQDKQFTKDE